MGAVVRATFGAAVSVNSRTIVTETEFLKIRAIAPHDKDIDLEVWAAFLSKLLARDVDQREAADIIVAYNAWMMQTYDKEDV